MCWKLYVVKIFSGLEISLVFLDINLTFGPSLTNFLFARANIPVVHCVMAVYVNLTSLNKS